MIIYALEVMRSEQLSETFGFWPTLAFHRWGNYPGSNPNRPYVWSCHVAAFYSHLFSSGVSGSHPESDKAELSEMAGEEFDLRRHRSVWSCEDFAIRYSSATGSSFSNTVVSLSALKGFDSRPFVVCVVRPQTLQFLLANSTFLKKISHTSQTFRPDNIRGSFNGSDILREFSGLQNSPENFEELFAIHREFTWEENVERLAEATGKISATGSAFRPQDDEVAKIMAAPALALEISQRAEYADRMRTLEDTVFDAKKEILAFATVDNVNERGNKIEQAITGDANAHGLADVCFELPDRVEISIEIKTKLLDRASSPKAYNIDKFLEYLARGKTAVVFLFVGVDVMRGELFVRTVSVFDRTILGATRVQFHWAGRNSRGVTQLTGDLSALFDQTFREKIDAAAGRGYLATLLRLSTSQEKG